MRSSASAGRRWPLSAICCTSESQSPVAWSSRKPSETVKKAARYKANEPQQPEHQQGQLYSSSSHINPTQRMNHVDPISTASQQPDSPESTPSQLP